MVPGRWALPSGVRPEPPEDVRAVTVLPPLQAPRSPDEAVVRVPPLAVTPVNFGMLVAAATLVLDQATKSLADRLLVPNRLVEIVPDWVPFFSRGWGWQLIYNPGGALGFSPDDAIGRALGDAVGGFLGQWFFVLVTGFVTAIVLRNLPRAQRLRSGVAYGLLLSGAWGNGIDRVVRPPGFPSGQVVDFIAIRVPEFFPFGPDLARFNVADVAIIVGFVLLLQSLGGEEAARDEAS